MDLKSGQYMKYLRESAHQNTVNLENFHMGVNFALSVIFHLSQKFSPRGYYNMTQVQGILV